ncbi:imelysin family protein [Mesorhizobium sp. 1B3]|uniref:imelysin family protein n=1 Tax=Mesorhizobium sp. 1B3 TaxID=3243599 RepID=UPI003D99214F
MALLALTLATAPALPTERTASETVGAAVEGFVKPAYAAFRGSTAALKSTVGKLCASPSPAALDAARATFGRAVRAWAKVEIIRIGPVTEENRLERVLYWPDRKGIGLRQVQAAIADQDASVTDPAKLAGKSVAMQGLGALEFVLFGTGSEELATGDAFRCSYGAAISGNLDTIAGAIEKGWEGPSGFGAIWTAPSPDNALYRTDAEALNDLLDIFVNGLELVRDQRVGSFLGETEKTDKPKQALFWRSQGTAPALAGNMAGMKTLFDVSGLPDSLPENSRWIAQSIDFEFGNAIRAAEGAKGPVEEVLADPERRGKLSYFKLVTTSLSELFGKRLSAELGLTAGFSSLDGD